MFKRETSGPFGRDIFGMGKAKKPEPVAKPASVFGRDTGFRDSLMLGAPLNENLLPPFVRSLKKLALHPGIVNRFHSGIIEYSSGPLDPEMKKLLELGKTYHGRGLRKTLVGLSEEDGAMVQVAVPIVKTGENGSRRVFPGISGESVPGRLFALVGARTNEIDDVIFEGIVVPNGLPIDRKHAVLVGIHSQTGKVFFHPDFLPGKRHKKVDQVIPPTLAHRLFPEARTTQSGTTQIGFFK